MRRTRRLQRTREWRPEVQVAPEILAALPPERGLWHVSAAERVCEEAAAAEQARLLRWVRMMMARRLTRSERRLVELYYFEALTVRQVARRRRIHHSTVSRGLRRAVGKLRAAALETADGLPVREGVLRAMTHENPLERR